MFCGGVLLFVVWFGFFFGHAKFRTFVKKVKETGGDFYSRNNRNVLLLV